MPDRAEGAKAEPEPRDPRGALRGATGFGCSGHPGGGGAEPRREGRTLRLVSLGLHPTPLRPIRPVGCGPGGPDRLQNQRHREGEVLRGAAGASPRWRRVAAEPGRAAVLGKQAPGERSPGGRARRLVSADVGASGGRPRVPTWSLGPPTSLRSESKTDANARGRTGRGRIPAARADQRRLGPWWRPDSARGGHGGAASAGGSAVPVPRGDLWGRHRHRGCGASDTEGALCYLEGFGVSRGHPRRAAREEGDGTCVRSGSPGRTCQSLSWPEGAPAAGAGRVVLIRATLGLGGGRQWNVKALPRWHQGSQHGFLTDGVGRKLPCTRSKLKRFKKKYHPQPQRALVHSCDLILSCTCFFFFSLMFFFSLSLSLPCLLLLS
ncbi:uncharacterized protein LOC142455077 [Tenrec ecaudatus]|uniref:uncharacterized protein LOC142455077 n=1 Tax=Tenrec ecaudatus TaxID=94439 RepID=UPI003F592423